MPSASPAQSPIFIARRPAAKGTALALMLSASAALLAGTQAPAPAFAQKGPDAVSTVGRAPLTFADIVERVKPAVVSVSVTNGGDMKLAKAGKGKGKTPAPGPGGDEDDNSDGAPGQGVPEDGPLGELFKHLPKEFRQQIPQARPTQAQGSGFIISPDGYVVTNNHVVENATKISVSFNENEKYDAELVGTDPRTDLALLKIKSSKTFQFVKFADNTGRVGDWVVAVGNPFGLGGTVTAGIISAFGRDIGSGPYDFIQIDASVNRGNSGGPTFNLDGDVIGVNTAIYSPSGGSVGIAFAIPSKTAKEVIGQLKSSGTVSRGWLGVKIQNVDEDTASSLGLTEPKGALVSEVTPNGPAAAAGLKAQDAILAINADKIGDSRELARKVAELSPNATVDVKVWRANHEEVVKVKLGTFPGTKEDIAKLEQGGAGGGSITELKQLGLSLAPGKVKEGVAIAEVDATSDAAEKGLKPGDIVMTVGGNAITTPDDLVDGIKKAKDAGRKAVLLQIRSGEQTRFVAVQIRAKG